jgi:hypothetical protein
MGFIDLHIHSTYSDGTKSPAALLDLAKEKGLRALAITDHDTVDGVAEALEYGAKIGVEVIPGIEISSWYEKIPMHILGYWLRHEDVSLHERLRKLQEGRHVRNERIIANLKALGFEVTVQELLDYSGHGQAGRPHIAQMLVDKGVVYSLDQAFSQFLGKGAAAYADRFKYPAIEAIAMIRDDGGVAVLAHPISLDATLTLLPGLLRALQALGMQGVEAYYPTHNASDIRKIKQMAEASGLVVTGGSDFHGNNRLKAPLGGTKKSRIPDYLLEPLRKSGRQD